MATKTIDGVTLQEMILAGAALLEQNRAVIDALNVFPVPDGDTGTNMSQTIGAAVREVQAHQYPTVGEVAACASKGALKGARGNSGVILSQILRGIAKALKGAEEMDVALFVKAMRSGSDTAYKAVMKPKEGTILTIQRVIAETLENANLSDDIIETMELVISAGNDILRKTPDMLPALKQAGVVDSGGKGLLTVYMGFLSVLKGEVIGEESETAASEEKRTGESEPETLEDIACAYQTECVVTHPKAGLTSADVAKLRRRLERIGECVKVVGDLEVVTVHLNTNDPGRALQMALELGEIDEIRIVNRLEAFRLKEAEKAKAETELKEYGIVAVALGEGLVNIFKDLSVDRVVDGGQTMNPSINEAIESVPARQVFVLPNNTNIILAAQQAAKLTSKTVYVLPTKSVPMGIAAAVAFMPDHTGEENCAAMQEAAEHVHTASVTYAVRDTTFDNREIHEGDIMALVDNHIQLLGHDIDQVASDVLKDMVNDDTELITIYYGSDIPEEQAQELCDRLSEEYDQYDVSVLPGGQPLYYYLIAVE